MLILVSLMFCSFDGCDDDKQDEKPNQTSLDFEFIPNGCYFVALLHESAVFGAGHVGFMLIDRDYGFSYYSANLIDGTYTNVKSLYFINASFSSGEYNYYKENINNKDKLGLAEKEVLEDFDTLYKDIVRYNRGFYIPIDRNLYSEMITAAMLKSGSYNLLNYNCLHYVKEVLSVINKEGVERVTEITPNSAFDKLSKATGGVGFDNFPKWLNSIKL